MRLDDPLARLLADTQRRCNRLGHKGGVGECGQFHQPDAVRERGGCQVSGVGCRIPRVPRRSSRPCLGQIAVVVPPGRGESGTGFRRRRYRGGAVTAIGSVSRHPTPDLKGQAGLAAAARPGQREQAFATEEVLHLGQLAFAADEAREGEGKILEEREGGRGVR